METLKVQQGKGQEHNVSAKAMPGEVLVIHVPDPYKGLIVRTNSIPESQYVKILAVGGPFGRFKTAPVQVGDIGVTATPVASVAVPGLYFENKLVHRLPWSELIAVAEDL